MADIRFNVVLALGMLCDERRKQIVETLRSKLESRARAEALPWCMHLAIDAVRENFRLMFSDAEGLDAAIAAACHPALQQIIRSKVLDDQVTSQFISQKLQAKQIPFFVTHDGKEAFHMIGLHETLLLELLECKDRCMSQMRWCQLIMSASRETRRDGNLLRDIDETCEPRHELRILVVPSMTDGGPFLVSTSVFKDMLSARGIVIDAGLDRELEHFWRERKMRIFFPPCQNKFYVGIEILVREVKDELTQVGFDRMGELLCN
jgi:hypothetical protein